MQTPLRIAQDPGKLSSAPPRGGPFSVFALLSSRVQKADFRGQMSLHLCRQ